MRNIIYIFFLIGTLASAQVKMSQAEAEDLKLKVKSQAATIHTLQSDFIQYKHLDFLANDIETSGKLVFKSPDIVKWEYTEPFNYSVLFKDKTLFINNEGNKSDLDVGSSDLFKQLNGLIVNSIKGDMFDEDQFTITYFKDTSNSVVHSVSKDEKFSKYIKAFHITFNAEGEVIELKMIEPTDDYTRIIFSNRTVNTPIADAVFAH
ncbi:outer membrane lipoprotein carrier protein LolA [Dokdonia sp.]|uniref:LolA family protein n=1 Tax=Dokdonia sp. TaxID=2024995 RepID=UPI003266EB7C